MHRTSPTFGKRSSAEPGLDCHPAGPHYTIEEPSPAYGWATACQADEWWETNGTYQRVSSYLVLPLSPPARRAGGTGQFLLGTGSNVRHCSSKRPNSPETGS